MQDSCTSDYIEQLIPSTAPIQRIKVKIFGNSGVGKTSLIESLRSGYFSSLFRRSKRSGSGHNRPNSSSNRLSRFNQRKSNSLSFCLVDTRFFTIIFFHSHMVIFIFQHMFFIAMEFLMKLNPFNEAKFRSNNFYIFSIIKANIHVRVPLRYTQVN